MSDLIGRNYRFRGLSQIPNPHYVYITFVKSNEKGVR